MSVDHPSRSAGGEQCTEDSRPDLDGEGTNCAALRPLVALLLRTKRIPKLRYSPDYCSTKKLRAGHSSQIFGAVSTRERILDGRCCCNRRARATDGPTACCPRRRVIAMFAQVQALLNQGLRLCSQMGGRVGVRGTRE